MGGDDGKVQETPQQRAMVELAINQLADYEKRWRPVQMRFAKQVGAMGADNSTARRAAAGAAATETTARFEQGRGALEAALAGSGAGLSSGRAKAALIGMGDDQATSRGMGLAGADQAVDDAYTQALGALASIGRGEKATATNAMAQQADTSARIAQNDAAMSAANRAGNMQLAGTVAGLGMGSALMSQRGPNIPKGVISQGPEIPKGFTRQGSEVYGLNLPNPQANY